MSTTRVSRSWSAGTVSISAYSHPALRPTASPRRFARTSRCRPRADSPPAQRRPLRLANLKTVERGMLVLVPFQPDSSALALLLLAGAGLFRPLMSPVGTSATWQDRGWTSAFGG